MDRQVRDALAFHAANAPDSMGLAAAARGRWRRRALRRRAILAGVAVVVATGSVLLAPAAWRAVSGPGVPADATAPRLYLVPPGYEFAPFPFTPGWAPDGVGAPYVGHSRDGAWLRYHADPSGSGELWVNVARDQPAPQKATITMSLPEAVHGRPATMRLGQLDSTAFAGLTWQHTDGRWITVAATTDTAEQDVRRFANALRPTPIPFAAPFTFDLVPIDMEPAEGECWFMQFRSADDRSTMVVTLTQPVRHQGARSTTVGELPGEIVVEGEYVSLRVFLDASRMLEVAGSTDGHSFRIDDLSLLARGVRLTDQARPAVRTGFAVSAPDSRCGPE